MKSSMKIVVVAGLLVGICTPGTAFAAASGGTIRGNNFWCKEGICNCDGSYTDCKGMEINCIDGKIRCDAPNLCRCVQVRTVKPKVFDKSIAPLVPEVKQ